MRLLAKESWRNPCQLRIPLSLMSTRNFCSFWGASKAIYRMWTFSDHDESVIKAGTEQIPGLHDIHHLPGRNGAPFEEGALKIIYLHMDSSADCLYRAKFEAPIMEGY